MRGRNLAPKDKSGTSDPYLVLSMGDTKEATSAVSKTLNPEWNQTFEFPVTSAESALLDAVCWDKDRFRKDYMGEFDVVLDELFTAGTTMPEPRWFKLESRRSGRRKQKKDSTVSGEVLLKFTLFDPINTAASEQHVLSKFHGITATSQDMEGEDDEDLDGDPFLSHTNSQELDDLEEEGDEDEKEDKDGGEDAEDGMRTPQGTLNDATRKKRRQRIRALKQRSSLRAYQFGGSSDVVGVLFLEINRITDLPPEKNMTRTSFDMDPFVVISLGKKTYRTRVIRHNLNPVYDEKLVFQVLKNETNFSLNFAVVDRDKFTGNDFVGSANFPVEKIKAFSPEADPDTGLYKLTDPDRVDRGRQRRFRLPMSRGPSANNVGRLSRNSSQNNVPKMTRTTSNTSLKGMASPNLKSDAFVDSGRPAPTSAPSFAPDPSSVSSKDVPSEGTNMIDNDDPDLNAYEVPLELKNKARWEDKHTPVLYIKAKYLPYKALRQQFWRAMLRQYDADESGKMDKVELVTMLDTLGSTLHNSTIDGFFKRFRDDNGGEDVLTMDQAVIVLEEQLEKSQETESNPDWKAKVRSLMKNDNANNKPASGDITNGASQQINPTSSDVPTLAISDMGSAGEQGDVLPDEDLAAGDDDLHADLGDDKEEHVVQIHECPICHQPRLARNRRTDTDIITHIATCASSDWRSVNNLVMAGFVTSSQAQRKWYSKVITKVRGTSRNFSFLVVLIVVGLVRRLPSWREQCQYPCARSSHWNDQ